VFHTCLEYFGDSSLVHPPLYNLNIRDARNILVSITCSEKRFDKCEVNSAIDSIHKMANDKSNIIYGVMKDNSLENTVNVAVIASGYDT